MAIRHFSNDGYPDIDLITSEICAFSGEESWRSFERISKLRGTVGFSNEQLDELIALEEKIGRLVFPAIDEICICGSQALHLPESYLRGDHDLDLIIRKNPQESNDRVAAILQEAKLGVVLKYFINDPQTDSREFLIDMSGDMNCLTKPFLQIYTKSYNSL